jgi:SulP family sulfate permease
MKSMLNGVSFYSCLAAWLKEEFQPDALLKSFTSGLMLSILEIIFAISFSALIFSGPLAGQLPYGIGWIVLGDAVLVGTVALLSSFRGMFSVEQDAPSALIAIATLAVITSMPASATSTQSLATVIVMIAGSTLLTGFFFILLGTFKLGGLVRFLPYPVIGGFLAGTGWAMITGGVSFMTNVPLGLELLQSGLILQWLPGLLLGGVMLIATSRFNSPLALPVVIASATALFYAVAWLARVPVEFLQAEGWLLGAMPSGNLWQFPFHGDFLAQVDWLVLWQHLPTLLPLPLISIMAMLLNTSGIELVIKKEINLSRELVVIGISNILGGLVGGVAGYPAISLTALNHKMNGSKRLPGLITAALIGSTVFVGGAFLTYIPKMILGALLIYVGLGMLIEWVYQAWIKFPLVDLIIILSILGIVIVSGFMQAVAVGLVMTIILFVVSYSRIKVVKHAVSGTSYRSRVTRDRIQQVFLNAQGDQFYILKLQGFIFFGTANSIFEQVRERASQSDLSRVKFVLLDFSQVSGLDSTGLLSFTKMLQFAQNQGIILVLTGLRGRSATQFTKGGFSEQHNNLKIFSDIDHGAEWYENQMLESAQLEDIPSQTLSEQLKTIWGDQHRIEKLLGYMNRSEIAKDQYLIHQGDDANLIFLIESGQVTAQLEAPGKLPVRLETIRGGRVIGELGFYLGTRRTASVIADEPSIVYTLSQTDLQEIEKNDPEAAYVFHRIVVHLMGERMAHLIKVVNALQD